MYCSFQTLHPSERHFVRISIHYNHSLNYYKKKIQVSKNLVLYFFFTKRRRIRWPIIYDMLFYDFYNTVPNFMSVVETTLVQWLLHNSLSLKRRILEVGRSM